MTVTYEVEEEVYGLGNCSRISWGITAYTDADKNQIAVIHDITSDRQALEELVEKCNRKHLSPIHLNDIVEDFLAG